MELVGYCEAGGMDILGVQNKATNKIHRIREFIEFNRVRSLEKLVDRGEAASVGDLN